MRGNFSYYNPTKLIFGENSLNSLKCELEKYGKNILLVYGGGSIKKTGLYDKIMTILNESGKNVSIDSGVMPNPTIDKLLEGIEIARKTKTDFILAVCGGSVIDYAKALAVSINYDGDPWKHYFLDFKEPDCEIIPVGSVLTMVGTGSEMNTGSVITNPSQKLKIGHVFSNENVFPKFSILDPTITYTIPYYQMVSGIYDIFNHICEQYFSGDDNSTSDYIMEGLMRNLIDSSYIAINNNEDYDARSNIMWDATWALNTLVAKGKSTDWMVHMLGQAVGAITNATHGMTLAAVSLPYYRYIMPYGIPQFKKFAINVFNVNPIGKTDLEIALSGLKELENWMRKIGVVMNITDLGATKDMINDIANAVIILNGGYKVLTKEEIITILTNSL